MDYPDGPYKACPEEESRVRVRQGAVVTEVYQSGLVPARKLDPALEVMKFPP